MHKISTELNKDLSKNNVENLAAIPFFKTRRMRSECVCVYMYILYI